jgi:transposase
MDRGMVSEDNLQFMKERGAYYLVGTPRSMLRKFEKELLQKDWHEVQDGVEVKLCKNFDNEEETFVLCRSQGRQEKENAILNRFVSRLEEGLSRLKTLTEKGKLKNRQKIERQIGRLMGSNSRAASLFEISVEENANRLHLSIKKNTERYEWALLSGGSYILRTNWSEADPKKLWKTYMQMTEAEDAFRITKSDLGLRPIFHWKKERTQAHILVCFLALVMWRTLQEWMKATGLGNSPRKLLEEMREIKSLDVLLPKRETIIRLRVVSSPSKELKSLLQRLKIQLPDRPKIIEDVVQKMRV